MLMFCVFCGAKWFRRSVIVLFLLLRNITDLIQRIENTADTSIGLLRSRMFQMFQNAAVESARCREIANDVLHGIVRTHAQCSVRI